MAYSLLENLQFFFKNGVFQKKKKGEVGNSRGPVVWISPF